jgi:hypothetical protein
MPLQVDKFEVKIKFVEDILGSWPADQDILTRFISNKAPSPWLQAEENDAVPERAQEGGYTVFPQDKTGLFLWNFHIKGFLKEAGNNLKSALKVKNLRSKIDNYVFIQPRKIYLQRDGQIITEPDDILERPVRAQTMQGPRVALVGSERVKAPAEITFAVEVVQNDEVTLDVIRQLLEYGAYKGLGQWRNGGWGSFDWEELGCLESSRPEKSKKKAS